MFIVMTNETQYRILVSGGNVSSDVTIGGSLLRVTALTTLGTRWHHVVFTYDGATRRLYLDGIQAASNAVTGNIATSANPLYIGEQTENIFPFNGAIDDVRIYNRALSYAEVLQLYNSR